MRMNSTVCTSGLSEQTSAVRFLLFFMVVVRVA